MKTKFKFAKIHTFLQISRAFRKTCLHSNKPNEKDATTSWCLDRNFDRKYDVPPSECTIPGQSCQCITHHSFFCHLAGPFAPTGMETVHWVRCINAIKKDGWAWSVRRFSPLMVHAVQLQLRFKCPHKLVDL